MPRNPENRFNDGPGARDRSEKEPLEVLQEAFNRFTVLSIENEVLPSGQTAWNVRDAGEHLNAAILNAGGQLGTGDEWVVALTRIEKKAYENAAKHFGRKPAQKLKAIREARELDILISTYEE